MMARNVDDGRGNRDKVDIISNSVSDSDNKGLRTYFVSFVIKYGLQRR